MGRQRYLQLNNSKKYLKENKLDNIQKEIQLFTDTVRNELGTNTKSRRIIKGFIVITFETHNILNDFIDKYWLNGKTEDGEKIIKRYKNIYFMYIKEKDSSGDVSSEFPYEKDLQNYLAKNLSVIEDGLELYKEDDITGIEYPVGGRFIDILAVDKNNDFVIFELKVSRGYDRVIGQLLRYMAWVEKNMTSKNQKVRGIIICKEISDDLKLASSKINGIKLYEYELSFKIKEID